MGKVLSGPFLDMDTAILILAVVCALIPGLALGMAFENRSIAAGSRILRFFRIIKS